MNDDQNTTAAAADTSRLEALGAVTQEVDAAHPTAEQSAQQQQAEQQASQAEQGARDWGVMLFSIGGLLSMIAPELKPVYGEERCMAWGQHMQLVCDKHGWSSPKNSPEFSLIMASAGFVIPTLMILPDKIRAARKMANSPIGKLAAWWARRRGAKQPPQQPEGTNGGQQ